MEFKTFNHATLNTIRSGRATIRFTRQGVVTISGRAVEKLSLSEGDKIEFCQSLVDSRDWYIHKTEKEEGFSVKKMKNGHGLTFNSSALSTILLDSGFEDHKSVAFVVSGTPEVIDGENYYFIITRTQIKK